MHTPTAAGRAFAALLLLGVLAGCGAAEPTSSGGSASASRSPSDSASPSPSPSVSRSPEIPTDGVTYAALGYRFGPTAEMSLPRTAVITAAVDQANNVTAVLSTPSAPELAAYLRASLPLAGFRITRDNGQTAQPAITFTGYGWNGSFTGDDRASAVLLRPV